MSDIIIRPVEISDCDQIVGFINQLSLDTGLEGKVTATADNYRHALTRHPPLFHGLVVEYEQNISGVCLYYPQYSSWRGIAGVYVLDVFIDTSVRSKSMGRRLLGAVCRDAVEKWQAEFMTLDVDSQNHGAIGFYHRLGFETNKEDHKMTVFGESFKGVAKG